MGSKATENPLGGTASNQIRHDDNCGWTKPSTLFYLDIHDSHLRKYLKLQERLFTFGVKMSGFGGRLSVIGY